MKKIFILILIFICLKMQAQAQLQVTFYVQADQDDWQLFMSKKLKADLVAGGKVVIITLTAGDAGNGTNAFGTATTPYYLAKEAGAIYSSKFAGDITNAAISPNNTRPMPTAQTVVINGKNLVKYFYGNVNGISSVVNYFFRLPDGGPAGDGFGSTGNKSLKRLKQGAITNIASVDGANTYTWSQLLATIVAIIYAESGSDPQVWLNTPSLNVVNNPNDHSDHIFSSTAAQEAVASQYAVGINEFVMDYASTLPVNFTNFEFEEAAAAFGNYNWGLIKNKYANTVNATTLAWIGKQYFTKKRDPVGVLPITLLSFTGTLKGNNVLLEWSTTSELNSKEFQIEKSNDGLTYRKLNTVPASGNSTTLKKYSYLDIEATELNYYRLKMVDMDGYNKQSDVVIVKNNGLTQAISFVGNPFKDYINIRFAKTPKGGVTLRLIDLSGKLISVSENYTPALSSIIRFDIGKAISRGMYILQIENEGKQYSIKVMKD